MSGGLGFIDIILFGMLAAFLVYRLTNVLGKRTGHEQRRPDLFGKSDGADAPGEENVVTLPDHSSESEEIKAEPESPLEAALTQIKLVDQNFDEGVFLGGARAAFEMVVDAFAQGDTDTLRNLLSDEVYENFAVAIRDRESKDRTLETTVVGVDVADIVESEIQGQDAFITVKYISEQVNVTREAGGEVVGGDPNAVVRVTDLWTFARDVSSTDPNWTLVATRSPN